MSDFGLNLPAALPNQLTNYVSATPIAPRLPEAQKALQNKYQKLGPQLLQLPADVRNALINYDAARVSQGNMPIPYTGPSGTFADSDTAKLLQTATTNQAATKPPDRSPLNVPGNFLGDLGAILKGLPRLPQAAFHALSNPAELVNFIPGSYIAQNLSNPSELLTHPLFTALDVLPYASKAASLTKVGGLAEDAAKLVGRNPRPVSALLTKTVDEAGQLAPNRLGSLIEDVRGQTRVGQLLDQSFGARNREMMRNLDAAGQRVVAQTSGRINTGSIPEEVIKQMHDLMEKYTKDDPAFAERIPKLTSTGALGDYSQYTARDLAFKSEYVDLTRKIGDYGVQIGDLGKIGDEFYPIKDATRVRGARLAAEDATLHAGIRQQIMDGTGDPNQLLQSAIDTLNMPRHSAGIQSKVDIIKARDAGAISTKVMRQRVRGYIAALDSAGFDVGTLQKAEHTARESGDWSTLTNALTDAQTNGLSQYARNYSISDISDAMRRYEPIRSNAPGDMIARDLRLAIDKHDLSGVTASLNKLQSRYGSSSIPEFADADFVGSIRRWRDRERYLGKNLLDANNVDRLTTKADTVMAKTIPARFTPARDLEATQRAINHYTARLTDPDQVAAITDAINHKRYDLVDGWDDKLYRGIQKDVTLQWQKMKQDGLDPLFVHTVGSPGQVARPYVTDIPTGITSVKKRTMDATPGYQDMTVALTHQAVEYLSRDASVEFIDHVARKWGYTSEQLRGMFDDKARNAATATEPYEKTLDTIIRREYKPFKAADYGYNWQSGKLSALDQSGLWLPKSMADNLDMIHNPRSILGGAFDPTTKLFRMAVIGLSPRTQLYNILGGATMVLGQSGPGAFRYIKQAREIMRDPTLLANEEMRASVGSARRFYHSLDEQSRSAAGVVDWMAGRTMGRLWGEIQQSKLAKAGGALNKLAEKSYDLNGLFDDAYRVMAYLHGRDRSLTRGLSAESAEKAGIEMSRKVLQDWAGMTPIERTVMRSVFPFYAFLKHSLGYVLKYPMDYPERAFVISKLGEIESADMGDSLPSKFLASVFLGSPDSQGNQTGLNMASVNPFGDVANAMTLAGFLGATNPIISTALESVGLDRGTAELYPSLRYDPETGRLAGQHRNPLLALVSNTVPQSDILMGLIGVNQNFKDQLRRDPQAALRSLASAGGLPVLWRQYNVPTEQFRAEMARQNAQDAVKNEALKTGDWTEAQRYPGLRDFFVQQMQKQQAGQLDTLIPRSPQEYVTIAQRASAGGVN